MGLCYGKNVNQTTSKSSPSITVSEPSAALIKNTASRGSLQTQGIITQEVVARNLHLTGISYIHTKLREELREMINPLIKTDAALAKKERITFSI